MIEGMKFGAMIGLLWVFPHGKLACFNATTGEGYFSRQRLEGIGYVHASPVGAGGRIYISGLNGTTQVIKHSSKYEVLAVNTLDDSFFLHLQ